MARVALAAFPLLAALALAGCSGGEEFHGTVEVDDDYFAPEEATVQAGESLHFEVEESAKRPHTVTIHKAGDPPSTLLLDQAVSAGDATHFEFAAPGTYHVWCKFHGSMTSGMHMLVTVE